MVDPIRRLLLTVTVMLICTCYLPSSNLHLIVGGIALQGISTSRSSRVLGNVLSNLFSTKIFLSGSRNFYSFYVVINYVTIFTDPIDCQWSPWSSCNLSCGNGFQSRFIVQNAQNGGASCEGGFTQSCNMGACRGKNNYNHKATF